MLDNPQKQKNMKKNVIKSTFVVVLLALAGFAGMKAYSIYATNGYNNLLALNIEALSEIEEFGGVIPCQIIDNAYMFYCYRICADQILEGDPYYDSHEEKWYKNMEQLEYVTETEVYRCLDLNAQARLYYLDHSIPLVECNLSTKTTCDSDESPTMPVGFNGVGKQNGRNISWREPCPAPSL